MSQRDPGFLSGETMWYCRGGEERRFFRSQSCHDYEGGDDEGEMKCGKREREKPTFAASVEVDSHSCGCFDRCHARS